MNKTEKVVLELMRKYATSKLIIRVSAIKEMTDRIETLMELIMPDLCEHVENDGRKTIMNEDILSTLSRIYNI